MFITSRATPEEALSELFSLEGYADADTEAFEALKHDRHLCPRFRDLAQTVLSSYKSYSVDAYDIQGPRDNGVDVLIKYEDDDGRKHNIGFQAKSFAELEDWKTKKSPDFMKTLKAQYASAIHNAKVDSYFVLLCTSSTAHRRQVRSICSELSQYASLKIILPKYALAAYDLPVWDVQAHVTGLLCGGDRVLRAAAASLAQEKPLTQYMIVYLMCHAFRGTDRWDNEDLEQALHGAVEFLGLREEDDHAGVFESLEFDGLTKWDGALRVNISDLPDALCALYFDQTVRLGLNADDMVRYLYRLLFWEA